MPMDYPGEPIAIIREAKKGESYEDVVTDRGRKRRCDERPQVKKGR